jgi:hypothetical protein
MGNEERSRAQLEKLRGRIRSWRLSRPKPRRMPEPLWQEAGALAASLGITRVAEELGLGFAPLKERAGDPSTRPSAAGPGGFLEVTGAELLGGRPTAAVGAIVSFRQPCVT